MADGTHRCWVPVVEDVDVDRVHLWGIAVSLELVEGAADDDHYALIVDAMVAEGFEWRLHQPERFVWAPPTEAG